MIISDQYRYVFVELPHTGSTAISSELESRYGGRRVLGKHSPYGRFLRRASAEQKEYFVFSCVRNPLDIAVTKYHKYLSNHDNPAGGARYTALGNRLEQKIFDYVQRDDVNFEEFFTRFYRLPYNSWACLDHHNFDFVMRFETLSDDFQEALRRLNIEPVGPLPVINQTSNRSKQFESYYTESIRRQAVKVFGPYMEEWGYEFPPEWHSEPATRAQRVKHSLVTALLKFYWLYAKPVLYKRQRVSPPVIEGGL